MSLTLPKPGQAYDFTNEANMRSILEQNSRQVQLRTGDFVVKNNKLILASPNGNQWSLTIDNSGTPTWTAL